MKRAWTKLRFRLAWLIMPAEVKELTLKPLIGLENRPGLDTYTLEEVAGGRAPGLTKRPTPLWLNRRQALFQSGYDPRDTATP